MAKEHVQRKLIRDTVCMENLGKKYVQEIWMRNMYR